MYELAVFTKYQVHSIIIYIRFFPKKTDLREISHQRIKEVENLINNRAVRKFNYLSPQEKLNKYCVAFIS